MDPWDHRQSCCQHSEDVEMLKIQLISFNIRLDSRDKDKFTHKVD
jgi:hypothetical protein